MNDSTIAFRAKERIPRGAAEPPKAVARGVLSSIMRAINDDPEFANYAIADGLKRAFTRFGKWCRKIIDPEPEPTEDDLLEVKKWVNSSSEPPKPAKAK